jgi:hypothetical protein
MATANPATGTAAVEGAPDGAGSVAPDEVVATEAEKPKFGTPSALGLLGATAVCAFDVPAATPDDGIAEAAADCVPVRTVSVAAGEVSVGGGVPRASPAGWVRACWRREPLPLGFWPFAPSLPASNTVLAGMSAAAADAVWFAGALSVASWTRDESLLAADVSAEFVRPFAGSPPVAITLAASGDAGAASAGLLRVTAAAIGWAGLAAACGCCAAVAGALAALPSFSTSTVPSLDVDFADGADEEDWEPGSAAVLALFAGAGLPSKFAGLAPLAGVALLVACAVALLPLAGGAGAASPAFTVVEAGSLPLAREPASSNVVGDGPPFRLVAFNLTPPSCRGVAGLVALPPDVIELAAFGSIRAAIAVVDSARRLSAPGAFGPALPPSAASALTLADTGGVEVKLVLVLVWSPGDPTGEVLPAAEAGAGPEPGPGPGVGPGAGVCGEFADALAGLGALVVAPSSKVANGGEFPGWPCVGVCCCHCGDTMDGAALTSDAILDTAAPLKREDDAVLATGGPARALWQPA